MSKSIEKKMAGRLRPLKIYDLDSESETTAELASFAAGLELLEKEIRELKKESCPEAAAGYGLSRWERVLFGGAFSQVEIQQRRARIFSARTIRFDGIRLRDMEKALGAAGVTAEITEEKALEKLALTQVSFWGEEAGYDTVMAQLNRILPAHLEIHLDMGEANWNLLDAKERSFDQWDEKDMSWDSLGSAGAAV